MQQQLAQLVATAQAESKSVTNRAEMEAFKARVVGPNGSLTAAMKGMATLSKEERPLVGKLINEAKNRSKKFSPHYSPKLKTPKLIPLSALHWILL